MTLRRRSALAGALALSLTMPVVLEAQNSFEDAIKQFTSGEVKGYTQPLADVLVANLSSGYFFTAGPRRGLGFSLELVAMGTSISDKMRTYTANTPQGFNPSTIQAPTVFGGKAVAVKHATMPSLEYRASDGVLDAEIFPSAVPQVRLSGFNTEVVVRFVDSDMLGSLYPKDDFPNLNVFGIGVRHSISQYVGSFIPLDLSINGSYSSMSFGDNADLKGTAFGISAGKDVGILSLMGGIESAGGTMNLQYTSTHPDFPGSVDVDLDAKRQVRFNLGAQLNLKVIKLFGTAGFGNVTTYSAGLRVGN